MDPGRGAQAGRRLCLACTTASSNLDDGFGKGRRRTTDPGLPACQPLSPSIRGGASDGFGKGHTGGPPAPASPHNGLSRP